jgi:hypothetical protein
MRNLLCKWAITSYNEYQKDVTSYWYSCLIQRAWEESSPHWINSYHHKKHKFYIEKRLGLKIFASVGGIVRLTSRFCKDVGSIWKPKMVSDYPRDQDPLGHPLLDPPGTL